MGHQSARPIRLPVRHRRNRLRHPHSVPDLFALPPDDEGGERDAYRHGAGADFRGWRGRKTRLRPGGRALVEVPFLYPIHDAPLDFRRWTAEGLHVEAARRGLDVEESATIGRPSETGALLFNLALSRLIVDWLEQRSPWLLITPLLALLILVFNLIGWALAPLQPGSNFMPHRAWIRCRKPTDLTDA